MEINEKKAGRYIKDNIELIVKKFKKVNLKPNIRKFF